jgi:prepilin-type processing-associated H-X9-DG protein
VNGPFRVGIDQFGNPVGAITFSQVTDGLGNTIFVGEKNVPLGQFGIGVYDCSFYNGDYMNCSGRSAGPNFPLAQAPQDPVLGFGSAHPGTCQFTFGDGSVRSLSKSTSTLVLALLANISDGQPLPDY